MGNNDTCVDSRLAAALWASEFIQTMDQRNTLENVGQLADVKQELEVFKCKADAFDKLQAYVERVRDKVLTAHKHGKTARPFSYLQALEDVLKLVDGEPSRFDPGFRAKAAK